MRDFLPATREEMAARGWEEVDVVLVTGDAYVDHPSFGVALIGRWLEAHGIRTAILAQPRHHAPDDFRMFGRPRLFFGITAGNLDSIVANYTGNGRVRDRDDYSTGGNPYFGEERSRTARRRPDRAAVVYAQLARAAYRDVPVVLGGLEASLRRFVHYDFQQEKLRASALTDAKADLLITGMGERAVLEVARRLERGESLAGIPGTCERLTPTGHEERVRDGKPVELPSWEDLQRDSALFLEAELIADRHARALDTSPILQRQQALWVLQNPPAEPLSPSELDALYELPYTLEPHPTAGDVPAWHMIRHSITTVRGCCGNCSFCAITRHQGPLVISRSPESVVREVQRLARAPHFRGTVSDLGGPTANLYGTSCTRGEAGACTRHDCLYPKVCRYLRVDEEALLNLLEAASAVEGVKHVYVSSGLRMELLLQTPRLLQRLLERHTPGALKIAPEHTESHVLRLMHKGGSDLLPRFLEEARRLSALSGRSLQVTPYFMSAHPGCTQQDMEALAAKVKRLGLSVRQFQDFTPTPGTLSTAMIVSSLDRDRHTPIPVTTRGSDRRAQREALEEVTVKRGEKKSQGNRDNARKQQKRR